MRVFSIIILGWLLVARPVSALELADVMQEDGLEITIRGLDGTMTGYDKKDIWIGVLNTKGYPVTITADEGFIFESVNPEVQDMILTEPLEMVASHEQYTETGLFAFCIQASNHTPDHDDTFRPKGYGSPDMRALASFIHQQGDKYQNMTGQDAMWVLSDHHSIYDVMGPGETIDDLRKLLAGMTGEAYDPAKVAEDIQFVDRRVKEYALYLKFYLEQREDIKLQLFNHKDEFVRDLLIRPGQEAGRYDMRYRVSLFGLIGEKYYVRLYVGEEERTEFTLFIKDS